jgi:uncharacterized integral membrane protein
MDCFKNIPTQYKTMKTKIAIIIVLIILLIIFVLQNTDKVDVKLWFWDISLPAALLLFVCFAIGLIVGLILPASAKKSKAAEPEKPKTTD